jgi:O-antigen/teichoic acid export membrane protein
MESENDSESTSDSLSTIAQGASVFAIGKIIYNILEFLLNIVLTRAVGASLYGVYAYASTILTATLVLTNGGTDKSVLKYIPQYEDQPRIQRFMLGLAFLTSAIGGIAVAGTLVLLAPTISEFTLDSELFVDTLRIFAIIVLLDTVATIVNSTFRALELVEFEILVDRVTKPALRLGAVAIGLYLGFSFIAVMASLLVASLLALLLSIWLFITQLNIRPSIQYAESSSEYVKDYYNFSIPLVAKDGASVLRSRVDILMVGFFLSSTAVGIYNVAVLVASLLILPLSGFNQLFPPIASRLYSNGQITELNAIYSTVTRWTFTITLFLGLGAIVYRTRILVLFGEEFVAGSTVLFLFVFGQMVNNAAGPSAYVLMMTENQYVVLVNQWAFGILNVVLNYIVDNPTYFLGVF